LEREIKIETEKKKRLIEWVGMCLGEFNGNVKSGLLLLKEKIEKDK